jgi:hypothetical protein
VSALSPMHFLGLLFITLFLRPPAQISDVRFLLATKDGNTTFRIGEEINLELSFSTDIPRKYAPQPCYPMRRFVVFSSDTFKVEPASGTIDPLRDSSYLMDGGPGSCVMSIETDYLGSSPAKRSRILNDWVQFTQPGHYRVQATTREISGLTLTSNAIEIDIVTPEPGWTAAQVQAAVATLRGTPGGMSDQSAAAATLRYLGTLDAVPALVELLSGNFYYTRDINEGLISSPHRTEVLSQLEAALIAPDIPISESWIDTLNRVAVAAALGPRPRDNDSAYISRFRAIAEKYRLKLEESLPHKKGQARAVSAKTLVLADMRDLKSPDENKIRALLDSFADLPDGEKPNLFGGYWRSWASPAAHAVVLAMAQSMEYARDDALGRLLEFSADEARQVVVDRVRRGDYEVIFGNFPNVLLELPDETLPELDDILATAYEQGRPVERLIARYATERIYPRVLASYDKRIEHCGEILPYFFRVDPDAATTRRKDPRTGLPCPLSFRMPVTRSTGLENVALDDMDATDLTPGGAALAILTGGSVTVKDALLKRLEKLAVGSNAAASIVRTILQPGDWVLTADDFSRLKPACVENPCLREVESTERGPQSPATASIDSSTTPGTVRIGSFTASSDREIRNIVRRLPANTQFRMQPVRQNWADQQLAERAGKIFSALGRQLQP